MGLPAEVVARYQHSEPVFGVVVPELLCDILLQMAKENERGFRELCEETGCFKETRIVGESRSWQSDWLEEPLFMSPVILHLSLFSSY